MCPLQFSGRNYSTVYRMAYPILVKIYHVCSDPPISNAVTNCPPSRPICIPTITTGFRQAFRMVERSNGSYG